MKPGDIRNKKKSFLNCQLVTNYKMSTSQRTSNQSSKRRNEGETHSRHREHRHRRSESNYERKPSSKERVYGESSQINVNYSYNSQFTEKDMNKNKLELAKIFLRSQDIIKRNTAEYDDFWSFLNKYLAFQQKSANTHNSSSKETLTDNLKLPTEYKKHHRLNFVFSENELQKINSRIPPCDMDSRKNALTTEQVAEFNRILLLYLDFLQKQKFNKLRKLRQSQANLPIMSFKNEIISSVKQNQVLIIAGDTGCGKSTQVPQYLLEAGWSKIACTQPRRIACLSLCKRVAYESLNEYGSEIGYQIRFEKSKTQHTKILFLTEGLLLRQVSTDPLLSAYNVIILDEVHERHLHGDFLLGIVKCLTIQRPDLKIILMSATINIDLFANYFDDAPVIQVPGRLFPIKLQYHPISLEDKQSKSDRINAAPYIRLMQLIEHKYPETERGDLLIFLSGVSEISTVVEAARLYAEQTKRWIVLPLHSTLSVREQDKVFDFPPEGVRKCIVATNIAETSITIDGVRFVIDSGKVKEMSYDNVFKMQRLQEFWISQASAEQRKGRAGRTGPGVCFRLYEESDYDAMSLYAVPEIQRVPLESLILQMISMGLPDARKFPFIEPPPPDTIENAIAVLKYQEAILQNEKLTPIGKLLSNLPVDIPIGKILIFGTLFHKMEAVLSLAAALSVQSPLTNRAQRDPDILAALKNLQSSHGDTFTLLNIFNEWLRIKADSESSSRKWCSKRGLEEQRFYEMMKLKQQFKDLLKDAGLINLLQKPNLISSTERIKRHGEMKQLIDLKRKYHRTPKQRKVLKLNEDYEASSEDDTEIDIRDVEFRLSHNKRQVMDLANSNEAIRFSDLILLKLIVCKGLYPHISIPDELNFQKKDADQLFHTKAKPYVHLHPLSIFVSQPDLLQLSDSDIISHPQFGSRNVLSRKHQMIAYMSLVETTKPFLTNNIRCPVVHSLLLLCQSIDTDQDFSRLVFDSWLEIKFLDSSDGQKLTMKAIYLRDAWSKILQDKVEAAFPLTQKEPGSNKSEAVSESEICQQLEDFFKMDVAYSVHRLLAADIKQLYSQAVSAEGFSLEMAFGENIKPNPVKGGFQLREYITYNCLCGSDGFYRTYLQEQWTCPKCEVSLMVNILEKMQHEYECHEDKDETKDTLDPAQEGTSVAQDPKKKKYFCDECKKDIIYTSSIDILKHKNTHKT